MLYICLHKEIALQNALRYHFALLSPARFSEFESKNSLPADAFSKKILGEQVSLSPATMLLKRVRFLVVIRSRWLQSKSPYPVQTWSSTADSTHGF